MADGVEIVGEIVLLPGEAVPPPSAVSLVPVEQAAIRRAPLIAIITAESR